MFFTNLKAGTLNPYAFSLAIKSSWERQTNAFDRAVRIAPNIFLLSTADFHFSNIDERQCWALEGILPESTLIFRSKRFKIFGYLFKHELLIYFRNI